MSLQILTKYDTKKLVNNPVFMQQSLFILFQVKRGSPFKIILEGKDV